MADKKLTDVTQATSSSKTDNVILIQSNAVKQIALSALQLDMNSVVQVEMRKYNGYVQWRKDSAASWQNLFSLTEIKGDTGAQGSPGAPGNNGINGKDGTTPSFSIGTVSTIENGQPATVTISGTKDNVILNFSIPKGLNGTGAGDVTTDQLNAAIAGLKIPKTLAELTDDTTHRVVTDAEKQAWNAKSNLTETRVNELIDAKMPRSAEGVQY